MTKQEMIAALKAAKLNESVLNVTDAEDTIANIEGKEVKGAEKAEGIQGLDSELPTQKDVEKAVAGAMDPVVPVDADGVSKNGGEDDKLMTSGGIEAEKKKQDNGMKDVINVSSRKVEEASEINNELLNQLQEAAEREEAYKAKIARINTLCEKALANQADSLVNAHAKEMQRIIEAVIVEGEKLEVELTEAATKNETMYKTAHALYESSSKVNKVLLEAVKKAQPEKKLVRYVTPARRALESIN